MFVASGIETLRATSAMASSPGWCTPTAFTRMLVMRVALVVCDFVIVVRRV
jgi:hypothetical protein